MRKYLLPYRDRFDSNSVVNVLPKVYIQCAYLLWTAFFSLTLELDQVEYARLWYSN